MPDRINSSRSLTSYKGRLRSLQKLGRWFSQRHRFSVLKARPAYSAAALFGRDLPVLPSRVAIRPVLRAYAAEDFNEFNIRSSARAAEGEPGREGCRNHEAMRLLKQLCHLLW